MPTGRQTAWTCRSLTANSRLRAKLQKTELLVRRKELALGVSGRKALAQLAKSPYITARMNARALKYRAREKLRNRKFELDRVERNYHRKKTGTRSFL